MKNIVISPFSRKLSNGKNNAKNFPYWFSVVRMLRSQGNKVVQIGVEGEEDIGAEFFLKELSIKDLRQLLEDTTVWISVDNFMNHFGAWVGKKGVVVFSKSDPKIFGHEQNINLLRDRKYLRKKQFGLWEDEEYDKNAFISPEMLVKTINENF